jgi:hypothetical protein
MELSDGEYLRQQSDSADFKAFDQNLEHALT